MAAIRAFLASLRQDCRAVTALEYGLIAAVVIIVGLAGFSVVGEGLRTTFSSVQTELSE